MVYKSQINTFQKMTCALVIGLIVIAWLLNPFISGLTSLIIGVILIIILLREFYVVQAHYLTVIKGLEKIQINIMDIECLNIIRIKEIMCIEIICNKRKIVIKPIETMQLIQHLKEINPAINIQNMDNTNKHDILPLINESLQ
ncbi:hypothetical protein [Macrococcoides caseolyticum]|uniref:hypothetical protein n=1 Tax=Macrococcoides caseolyticum TaxID=69966 RepID=UPI001F2DCFA5|nr:hypothetical protein [Macrococcus caseolyticus]MCE4956150.1 hypothetical protein [Macrococcus caseolyticus]